ncbi:MAG: S9 family peptidase, partial [Pyrinomonadaceae bacterium]
MSQPEVAPYGSWKSPITSDLIVTAAVSLGQIALDGEDVYWVELRPSEGGRNCVVRRTPDGTISDVTPRDFNARTRVHEYGGGDFAVRDGVVYFTNFTDQRVYRQRSVTAPHAITPEGNFRYSDFVVDARRGLLFAVREDHTAAAREAVNTLVSLRADGANEDGGLVLASGNDFYSTPRLSPDGSRLAWLTWNHPNMPWDGCELWVGELDSDGALVASSLVAGGGEESIFQPEWSPSGVLHFVSDRNNWWNIYRLNDDGSSEAAHETDAEFALPQWLFGMCTYAFAGDEHIVCAYARGGDWRLGALDTRSKRFETFELPYTDITYVRAGGGRAFFRAGAPTERSAVVELDAKTGEARVLRRTSETVVNPD